MEHTYKLKYTLRTGKFKRNELNEDEDSGACDAIVIHSIVYHENAWRDEAIFGIKNGKPIEDDEIFISWINMTHHLSKSKTLPESKKAFAKLVFEYVKEALKKVNV